MRLAKTKTKDFDFGRVNQDDVPDVAKDVVREMTNRQLWDFYRWLSRYVKEGQR